MKQDVSLTRVLTVATLVSQTVITPGIIARMVSHVASTTVKTTTPVWRLQQTAANQVR